MTNRPAQTSPHLKQREAIKLRALPACVLSLLVAATASVFIEPPIAVVLAYGFVGAIMFCYWHLAESRPSVSLVFGTIFFVCIGVFSTKLQFGTFGEQLIISISTLLTAFFALVNKITRRHRAPQPKSNAASSGASNPNDARRDEA